MSRTRTDRINRATDLAAAFVRHGLPALAAAIVAVLLIGPLTAATAQLGPGTVEVSARLDREGTELEVPPLGRVSAATHRSAVGVEARLVELDVDALQRQLSTFKGARAVREEIAEQLPDLMRTAAVGAAWKSALLGAVVGLLLPYRRWWHALVGAVGAVVAVAVALGGIARSYDVAAFSEPSYDGALSRAPTVFEALERHVDGFGDVQDRVATLSAQLNDLFAAAGGTLALDDGADTTILHVSDIHSNPLGVEVANRLAESFDVDAVLDTGDLTSFGIPLEASVGNLIGAIDQPWYLVAGNHDSPAVRASLAAVPNIVLLDGTVADIDGVSVLGVSDPTFTATNDIATREATELKLDAADEVAALTRSNRPDVLAVHDPVQADEVAGLVPLVVAGHVHETTSEVREGTRFLTIGSTGATGLGSFTVEASVPYEAELLRFDDGRLVAIDRVQVDGLEGGFVVEREVIDEEDAAEDRSEVDAGERGRGG